MTTSPLPWTYRILTHTQHNGEGTEALILNRHGIVIGIMHDANDAELITQLFKENEQLKNEITNLELEIEHGKP